MVIAQRCHCGKMSCSIPCQKCIDNIGTSYKEIFMEKIKFTELNNNQIYERDSDGKLFKRNGDKYFFSEEGSTFKEVNEDDLKLSDRFSKTHKIANDSLMNLYNEWKQGEDIGQKNALFDRIIRGLIAKVEEE